MTGGKVFGKLLFRIAGDKGLIVELGEEINPETNARVRALAETLAENNPPGILEIIPTYRSLLLIYDPFISSPETLMRVIEGYGNAIGKTVSGPCKVIQIPVCYGGKFGPDIENVGKSANLDQEEVIRLHSEPEYLIYMVGFTPGFPFLGGLNKKLFTPRLTTPRMAVSKGSVGIANNQTGMYPIKSPGGWQIIGRTPLTLFSPGRKNPFLYKAGDKIKFIPISEQEYTKLKLEGKSG